jgi:hypothetical protein
MSMHARVGESKALRASALAAFALLALAVAHLLYQYFTLSSAYVRLLAP